MTKNLRPPTSPVIASGYLSIPLLYPPISRYFSRRRRHFISFIASEVAQSSRVLHSEKQPSETFPPSILCPSGRRQQRGGEKRWVGEHNIRERVARRCVAGCCKAAMWRYRMKRAVCKTTAERHRKSVGTGRLQMASCHHRGTALTVGMGVKRLRRSEVQN
jgi:hypothetical protein